MADLSLYKVDLDTPQPNGRNGESPRAAFTKYNDLIAQLEGGAVGNFVGSTAPTQTYALMEWIDTSTSPATIKRRNSLNTAWVSIGSYDQKIGTAAGANLPDGVTELKNTVGISSSQTAKPNEIPVANASGVIDDSWLGDNSALSILSQISQGKWTEVKDSFGNSQVEFILPLTTYETLNIPDCPFTGPLDAFIRPDGSLRPHILVSVYKASSKGGKAVSQAGRDPFNRVNLDTARVRCTELGSGGRIAGRYVYAAIVWMMISNNYQPRGNTEFGRSHSNINEFGRRADGRVPNDRAGEARTLTGTGPNTWNHDGTAFGIADLVGNVWEREDDFKMVNGQFFVAEHLGQAESSWVATGVYISSTGQFTNTPPTTLNFGDQVWGNMPKAPGYPGNEKLQRLIIEPIECTKHLMGRFYWDLGGESVPRRGGNLSLASSAGPAALSCFDPRSTVRSDLGFRAAFVS
ncbi:hypothetical protein M3908_003511 [Vibrio metschnikovii]|nr:hypothetical protein [Vibrio metschnikovii]